MHHQDPQWEQYVIKEDCWSQLDFNSWSHLDRWEGMATVTILDTTNLTIKKVARFVTKWIKHNAH